MKLSAEVITGTPEHYQDVVLIGKHRWECTGYARTGRTVRFSRLVETSFRHKGGSFALLQKNIYIQPKHLLEIVSGE